MDFPTLRLVATLSKGMTAIVEKTVTRKEHLT